MRFVCALVLAAAMTPLAVAHAAQINLGSANTCYANGDSIEEGRLATGLNGYVQQLCAERGLPLTNHSADGANAYQIASSFWANPPPAGAWIQLNDGMNDLISGGSNPKTQSMIANTLAALVGAALSTGATAFSNVACPGAIPVGGPQARGPTLGGSNIELPGGKSCTFAFSGDNLIVGSFSNDGSWTLSRFTISVGTASVTVNGNGQDNGLTLSPSANAMPMVTLLTGLGAGLHTATISAIDSGNVALLDWIGTLAAPAAAPPIMVQGVVHINAGAQAALSAHPLFTNANIDSVNAAVAAAVGRFTSYGAYQVVFADPNASGYDPQACGETNWVHPVDCGHAAIRAYDDTLITTGGAPPAVTYSPVFLFKGSDGSYCLAPSTPVPGVCPQALNAP